MRFCSVNAYVTNYSALRAGPELLHEEEQNILLCKTPTLAPTNHLLNPLKQQNKAGLL